jgi:hypothetical protein
METLHLALKYSNFHANWETFKQKDLMLDLALRMHSFLADERTRRSSGSGASPNASEPLPKYSQEYPG